MTERSHATKGAIAPPREGDELRARVGELAAQLSLLVPASACAAVRVAIEHGHLPWSVNALAAALGVPRKSMDRRLAGAITLSARQLLAWGRLLAAGYRLRTTRHKVAQIARELSFGSPPALFNLAHRYAGLTPTQLRELGGDRYLASVVARALKGA